MSLWVPAMMIGAVSPSGPLAWMAAEYSQNRRNERQFVSLSAISTMEKTMTYTPYRVRNSGCSGENTSCPP